MFLLPATYEVIIIMLFDASRPAITAHLPTFAFATEMRPSTFKLNGKARVSTRIMRTENSPAIILLCDLVVAGAESNQQTKGAKVPLEA